MWRMEETVTSPHKFVLAMKRNNDVNIEVNIMLYGKQCSSKNIEIR